MQEKADASVLATRTFVRAVRPTTSISMKPVFTDFFASSDSAKPKGEDSTEPKDATKDEKTTEKTDLDKDTKSDSKSDSTEVSSEAKKVVAKPFGSTFGSNSVFGSSSSIFGSGSGSLISFGSVKASENDEAGILGTSGSSDNSKVLEGLTTESGAEDNKAAPGANLVEVEVEAGDDNDTTIFKLNVKCFLLVDGEKGKEYKQRGSGDLCVNTLTVNETTKARLIMRVEKTQLVIVNSLLFPQMARDIVNEKHVRVSVLETEGEEINVSSGNISSADITKSTVAATIAAAAEANKEEKDEKEKKNEKEKKSGPRVLTYLFRCKNASEANDLLAAINSAISMIKEK